MPRDREPGGEAEVVTMPAERIDKLIQSARLAQFGLVTVCFVVGLAQLTDPAPVKIARDELRYLRSTLDHWVKGVNGGGFVRFLEGENLLGELVRVESVDTLPGPEDTSTSQPIEDDTESPVVYDETTGTAGLGRIVGTPIPKHRVLHGGPNLPVYLAKWPEVPVFAEGYAGALEELEDLEHLGVQQMIDAWDLLAEGPLVEVRRDRTQSAFLTDTVDIKMDCTLASVESNDVEKRRVISAEVKPPLPALVTSIFEPTQPEDGDHYYFAVLDRGHFPHWMWPLLPDHIGLYIPVVCADDADGTRAVDVVIRYAAAQNEPLGEALVGRNRPFRIAFSTLHTHAVQYPGIDIGSLDAHLTRELYRGAGEMSFLGLSVPVYAIRVFGLIMVFAAQLYFSATLLQLRDERKQTHSAAESPWIALYSGALSAAVMSASLLAPTVVIAGILCGAIMGRAAAMVVLAMPVFGASVWLLVRSVYAWRQLRRAMPTPHPVNAARARE